MRARDRSFLIASLFVVALTRIASAESQEPTPAADRTTDHQTRELKCLAARAEPWPQGFVKMTIPGKDDQFIPEQRITKITSADGTDWTDRVIVQRQAVEGEDLEVCYSDAYPAVWNLRGHPKAVQEWFPVLQAGTLFKLSPDQVPGDRGNAILTIDVGAMKNVGQRTALGGSAYFGFDPDQTRLGAKARFRYWLSRSLAIDVAPGVIAGGTGEDYGRSYSYPGFVGELSFSMGDWMVVTGQVETRSVTETRNFAFDSGGTRRSVYPPPFQENTFTSWSLGAKFGGGFSVPGLLLSAFIVGSLTHDQGWSF